MTNGKKKKDLYVNLDESLKNLNKSLENYQKYLKKIQKKNPSKSTDFEINTAALIYNIGETIGEMASGIKDVKDSITTQTIVSTIGIIGLGVVIAIGFALT